MRFSRQAARAGHFHVHLKVTGVVDVEHRFLGVHARRVDDTERLRLPGRPVEADASDGVVGEVEAFHRDHVVGIGAHRRHDNVRVAFKVNASTPLVFFRAADEEVHKIRLRLAVTVEQVGVEQLAQGALHVRGACGILDFVKADIGCGPAVGVHHQGDRHGQHDEQDAQGRARGSGGLVIHAALL